MITAIVLAKNEERNIKRCIMSLKWCDEILVIDDNSTDKTAKIAKNLGASVLTRAVDGDFAKQRNFGMMSAKNDWVLFVDADEFISDALSFEIQTTMVNASPLIEGYFVRRWDMMWGRLLKHGEIGNVRLLRFGKKQKSIWIGKIHETWYVPGQTSMLINPLIHNPHPSIKEFLEKINTYSSLRADELFEKKKTVTWWEIILYPKVKFVLNYFLRRGYLDGTPGLIVAFMMSLHSFLVRGKLWFLWQRK